MFCQIVEVIKKKREKKSAWVTPLVKRLPLAQIMIPESWGDAPVS